MKRDFMDRVIDTIEWLAALFIGIVALDIFVAVVLRKFFNTSIPDSYDFGKLLLGTLIFWGIAATSYRGTHITVDLVWSSASVRGKRYIDVFATLVLLFVVTVHTFAIFRQGARHLPRPRADLRPEPARLAAVRAGLGGRCGGRDADCHPHLAADLPAGTARRAGATAGRLE